MYERDAKRLVNAVNGRDYLAELGGVQTRSLRSLLSGR